MVKVDPGRCRSKPLLKPLLIFTTAVDARRAQAAGECKVRKSDVLKRFKLDVREILLAAFPTH